MTKTTKRRPINFWTLERCQKSALKFKTRSAWAVGERGAHKAASRNGWLDLCCGHMKLKQAPAGTWTTFKVVLAEAKKYKNYAAWAKGSPGSLSAAERYGWTEKCKAHMTPMNVGPDHWRQFENVLTSAQPFASITEWERKHSKAVQSARQNGWMRECVEHMELKPNWYWDKAHCLKEARKHLSQTAWKLAHAGSFRAATNNGWLEECTAHMNIRIASSTWDFDSCMAEAAKYSSKTEWAQNHRATYNKAISAGWLEACIAHMPPKRKPMGHWNVREHCLADAKLYATAAAWSHCGNGAMDAAAKNGWYDECVAHMERCGSENNVIYIWRAKELQFNGLPVYKMGHTSDRSGKSRIKQVAKDANLTADIVVLKRVTVKATTIERVLHKLGHNPRYAGFDGCTEFRALDRKQLQQAVSLINRYAA